MSKENKNELVNYLMKNSSVDEIAEWSIDENDFDTEEEYQEELDDYKSMSFGELAEEYVDGLSDEEYQELLEEAGFKKASLKFSSSEEALQHLSNLTGKRIKVASNFQKEYITTKNGLKVLVKQESQEKMVSKSSAELFWSRIEEVLNNDKKSLGEYTVKNPTNPIIFIEDNTLIFSMMMEIITDSTEEAMQAVNSLGYED
jgi:hypothetical protein